MNQFRGAVVPAFLLASLLLGGSPQGIWRNFALQMAAIVLLGWALLARHRASSTRDGNRLLQLALLWFILVLAQLVPLPPAIWTELPGRQIVAEAFMLRGQSLPWLPWSLAPAETAAILPVMLVPLAVIAGMVSLGAYRSALCIVALATGTMLSVLLGALQLTQGGPYLFPIHNEGAATGLFANANHQATLLLALIPFLAVALSQRSASQGHSSQRIGLLILCAGAMGVVLLGLLLNGSLAALLLAGPVVAGSLIIALRTKRSIRRAGFAVALAMLLAAAGGIALFTNAGATGQSIASRADIFARTTAAIKDTFPVGTGLGSFDPFYRLYEDPALVDRWFVNHAHSDLLEWVLETGLPGTILLVAFLGWWMARAWAIWRSEEGDPLALAGTVATAATLAHSLVDYPLRDAAVQAVFAMGLAFMTDARARAVKRGEEAGRPARHLGMDDVAGPHG